MKPHPTIPAFALLLFVLLPVISFGAPPDRPISPGIIAAQIAKEPNSHPLRVVGGFLLFDQGKFEAAETHFRKATQLTPEDAYDRAWLFMAQLRRDKGASDKDIRAFLAKKHADEFIYTDIGVLLSDITPEEAVEKAKASGDAGNLCEAHYYAAQRLLADGQIPQAKAHLMEVLNTKKETFWEYRSAIAWLKSL